MPPSALDQLTRLNVVYPMLFKLTNRRADRVTHCGVLEFVADEGKVYLPYWVRTDSGTRAGADRQHWDSSAVGTGGWTGRHFRDVLTMMGPTPVISVSFS